MPSFTAPALLIGLGARILLETFTRSGEASVSDFVLIGVWQGVALHYASRNSGVAIIVGIGIFSKLLVEFNLRNDATRSATTLLGVALGVLSTEFLSQFFDTGELHDSDRRRKRVSAPVINNHAPRRERVVQFRSSVEGDTSDARYQSVRHNISDITSIDSNSEMIGSNASTMTPLDRDIAALRTRASLADSERRRFKEERKWAISQGNTARAAQMKWQVKRYTALMQSFHREADAKLIEASGGRPRYNANEEMKNSSSRNNRHRRDEPANGSTVYTSNAHTHGSRPGISKSALRDTIR